MRAELLAVLLLATPALAEPTAEDQRTLDRALVDAVERGDPAAVAQALADGGDPDAVVIERRAQGRGFAALFRKRLRIEHTPLGDAVDKALGGHRGAARAVEVLLEAGADPDGVGGGDPPAVRAARATVDGRTEVAVAVLDDLLDAGASTRGLVAAVAAPRPVPSPGSPSLTPGLSMVVDRVALRDGSGRVLCEAAEVGDAWVMRAVLVGDADPDTRCAGRPALVLATATEQGPAVGLLLGHGADPSAADPDGTTALHLSVTHDLPPGSLTRPLVEAGADRAAVDGKGQTPWSVARVDHAEVLAEVPLTDRDRAARLAAWIGQAPGVPERPEEPLIQAWTPPVVGRVVDDLGLSGWIDLAGAVGLDRLTALAETPGLGGPGEVDRPWSCDLDPRAGPRRVRRSLGDDAVVVADRGPVREVRFARGAAGFLRAHALAPRRLRWSSLPTDCDPLGGSLLGLPADAARVVLGPPHAVVGPRMLWPWPDAPSLDDRPPWLVVRSDESVIREILVDWRRY